MIQRLEDDIQLLETQNQQLMGRQQQTEKKLGQTEFEVQLMKNLMEWEGNIEDSSESEDLDVLPRGKGERTKLRGVIGKVLCMHIFVYVIQIFVLRHV